MATVEDFILKVRVEGDGQIKNLQGSIQGLNNTMSGFGGQAGAMRGAIGGIIASMGGLAAIAGTAATAFAALGVRAVNIADALTDISNATGISTSALLSFKQSLIEAGGSSDDFATLATKLNQTLGDAAVGNEKAQESFRKLGVFVRDANGNTRDTESVLRDVISRLAAIEDPATRASVAVDLFGKSANKLDLSKLQAVNDPFKDEQIRQLEKYKGAIDTLINTVENKLITVFGQLAIAISDSQRKAAEMEAQMNKQGRTYGDFWERMALGRYGGVNPFGVGGPAGTRPLTEAEKQTKQLEAEYEKRAKLMESYKTRAGTRAEGAATGQGDFGATPEATLKAIEQSEKRIAQSKAEAAKAGELKRNADELAIRIQGLNQREIIEVKSQNDLNAISIGLEHDLAKAKSEIFAQERLTAAQKEAEFQAKTVELTAKAEEAKSKLRQRLVEDLDRENKRIQEIIKTSQQLVQSQRDINDQQSRKLDLFNDTLMLSDRERKNAEELFQIEEERTKQLRAIQAIKDLPGDERLRREQEINDVFNQRRVLTRQQQDADQELMGNFEAGYRRAYANYAESSKNAFDQATNYFNTFTRGFEDAWVKMIETGKFSWRDLVNTMIAEIARVQARKFITNLLGATSVGGGGGLFGGAIIPGFLAEGGPTTANKPYIVGEKGPELFIPRSAGTVIPNDALGAGSSMAGNTVVTYNISAVDAQSFKAMIARDPSFIHAVAMQGASGVPSRR